MSKSIGRQFKSRPIDLGEREILLPNGEVISFLAHRISANEVAEKTVVNSSVNGRDQDVLTAQSVADITRTISSHQWFPVIAKHSEDGQKIEILDGSRRRLAAIEAGVGLDLLLAEKGAELSSSDAKAIAKEIQTAREHSIRDIGVMLLPSWNQGKIQTDIAKEHGLSVAKVNRALTAARVPIEMVRVFPDPNELSHQDYKVLLKISDALSKEKVPLDKLLTSIYGKELKNSKLFEKELKSDEMKSILMTLFQSEFKALFKKSKNSEFVTKPLLDFPQKDKYARKKEKTGKVLYEFSRLEADVRADLDKAISEVLERHYEVQEA